MESFIPSKTVTSSSSVFFYLNTDLLTSLVNYTQYSRQLYRNTKIFGLLSQGLLTFSIHRKYISPLLDGIRIRLQGPFGNKGTYFFCQQPFANTNTTRPFCELCLELPSFFTVQHFPFKSTLVSSFTHSFYLFLCRSTFSSSESSSTSFHLRIPAFNTLSCLPRFLFDSERYYSYPQLFRYLYAAHFIYSGLCFACNRTQEPNVPPPCTNKRRIKISASYCSGSKTLISTTRNQNQGRLLPSTSTKNPPKQTEFPSPSVPTPNRSIVQDLRNGQEYIRLTLPRRRVTRIPHVSLRLMHLNTARKH